MNQSIKIFTTENPGKDYTSLGIVNGIQVRSMNIFTDIMVDIANVFGTGKKDWTKVKNLFDITDRSYVLGEQTVIAEGTSRELLKSSKAIEHYFGSQFS